MAHIEIEDLTVEYELADQDSMLIALWEVSLNVDQGEFIVVVGPSGCGKTTLINAVAGLLKPTSGSIRVHGKPVTGPGPDRAMVFQEYALLPWRTVTGNVEFGVEMQSGRSKDEAKIQEAIAQTGFVPNALAGALAPSKSMLISALVPSITNIV